MKEINIRTQYVYQADYIDLDGIKIADITKDLKNIQDITCTEDSNHLCIFCNTNFENILTYNGGVNKILNSCYGKDNSLNSKSNLSNKGIRGVDLKRELVKVVNKELKGILFLHTLLYKSELYSYFTHMSNFMNYKSEYITFIRQDNHYNRNEDMEFISIYENCDAVSYQCKGNPLTDEKYNQITVTIMFPVYSLYDYLKSSTEIYSTITEYKEHSILNLSLSNKFSAYRGALIEEKSATEEESLVRIKLTYFPKELSPSYYNKYVTEMITKQSLKITSGIISIQGDEEDWNELNSVFAFKQYKENLINTCNINKYAGSFLENSEYIISMKQLFLLCFMADSIIFNNLFHLITYHNKKSQDNFKIVINELITYENRLNSLCKKFNIDPIVSSNTFNGIIYFMCYFFIETVMENAFDIKSLRNIKINTKGTISILTIGNYNSRFDNRIKHVIIKLIAEKNTDEIIEIVLKAKELWKEYIIDKFKEFLTFNKDFSIMIESYRLGRKSDDFPNIDIDYKRFVESLLYSNMYVKTLLHQFTDYYIKITNKKYNTKTKGKRSLEYRLFDVLVIEYTGHILHYSKAVSSYFANSDRFMSTLSKKLSKEQYIKNIITTLETNL